MEALKSFRCIALIREVLEVVDKRLELARRCPRHLETVVETVRFVRL